jgi:hypothetical protein
MLHQHTYTHPSTILTPLLTCWYRVLSTTTTTAPALCPSLSYILDSLKRR